MINFHLALAYPMARGEIVQETSYGGGIAIGLPNKPATKVIDGVERFTVQDPEISQNDGFGNPYSNAFRQNTSVINNDALANAYLAFEPIDGLTLKLTTAANYQGQNVGSFQNRSTSIILEQRN